MIRIQPLYDHVCVRLAEEETTTNSGIILSLLHTEKPSQGTVVGIGPEVSSVKVGDTVVFGKYTGTETKVNNEDFVVLSEDELLGVLEEDN